MKTATRLSAVLGALVLAVSVAASAAPDLSGTWVLDRSQSEFHKRPGAEGGRSEAPKGAPQAGDRDRPEVKLNVAQSGNTLKVTRMVTMGTRERTMSETYTTDGSERREQGRRHGTSVTKAAWDGDRLVIDEHRTFASRHGEMQTSRSSVWTVAPDGRTLTIETTMQGPRGERQVKRVYQKS